MQPKHAKLIAKMYGYQYVCKGSPEWPSDISLTEEIKTSITSAFNSLRDLIDEPVTLKSLSSSPGKYVRCFRLVLESYEIEHRRHCSYDVRRLSLPRLFSLAPIPSCKWKYIAIDSNTLASFVRKSLPKGYRNQLDLYQEVFNLETSGVEK